LQGDSLRTTDGPLEAVVDMLRLAVRSVWKRRWMVAGIATLLAALLAVAIPFVPNRYEAAARVYVDTQTVLKPLMSGLAFQADVDQQVRMLARTLITRPNVERLLETSGLGLEAADDGRADKAVDRLMKDIRIIFTGSENLFEIQYRGIDRERALRLVEATVNLFVKTGAGSKKQDSQEAGRFIEQQIQSYEVKLTEAENRLKDFKVRNFGITGVSNQDYFSRVSVLSEEVGRLRVELGAAERRRETFQRELANEEPLLLAEAAPPSPAVAEVETRLNAQRKQLDELLHRFTEQHPDVISARRIIGELEADAAQRRRAEAERVGKQGNVRQAATSPIYQRLRVSLADAEAAAAALRGQLAMKQAALDQARSVANRAPQVEAELAQLNRDYDIVRKTYEQMVARREAATLGSKLDESSQLAEFRMVEPPKVSQKPIFPSQFHLALMAMVGSIAVGVAAAVAIEYMRPTVQDVKSLRRVTDRPVLGKISTVASPANVLSSRHEAVRFGIAACALLAAQATWTFWIATRLVDA